QVGMAQAGGSVLDQYLAGAGIVEVELDDLERFADAGQDGCSGLHDGGPFEKGVCGAGRVRGPAGRAGGGACGGPGAHYARAPDSQLDVHRAGLGVEVESTLAQLAAPAGLLEATERHRGVEAVVL